MSDTIPHEVLPSGARYSSACGYLTAADELRDLHVGYEQLRRDLAQRNAAAELVLAALRERLAVATARHARLQARRESLARNGGKHCLVAEFRAREQAALDRVLDAEVALRDVELVLAGARAAVSA